MTDKIIFKFSVYDDKSGGRVYWDADMKVESAEDGMKIMRMLQAAQTDMMDIILKTVGINIDNEQLHRRTKTGT